LPDSASRSRPHSASAASPSFDSAACLLRADEVAEVEVAAADVAERPALVLADVLHHPFVDSFGQQQHLDALLPQALEVRAVPRGVPRFAEHVVDVLLAGPHPRE
jgi:hypothetical protein